MKLVPLIALITMPALADTTLQLGSGLTVTRDEVLFEPPGAYDAARRLVRLRYVSDQLPSLSFDRISGDFQELCERDGLAVARDFAPNATQLIVSLSSEAVAFGETAPNVVQYFDAFRREGDTCIWEGI